MAKIQYIKDNLDETVLPVTHERAVLDSDGGNLESKMQILEQLDEELNGVTETRDVVLGWEDPIRYSTTRVYKHADDKSLAGDVFTAKLSDYTNYKFGIELVETKNYSTTTGYDSQWQQHDLSYTVPEGKDGYYFRVTMAKANDSNITIEEAEAVLSVAKVERVVTYTVGGFINESQDSINELEQNAELSNRKLEQFDSEIYGGEITRIVELDWPRFQMYSNNRAYKTTLDKSLAGDVFTAKLSDYTNYQLLIALVETQNYSTTTGYNSQWQQHDLSYTVPEGNEGYYFRIVIAKVGDTPITTEEANAVLLEATVIREVTDDTIGLVARVDELENPYKPPVGAIEVPYYGDKVVIDTQKHKCYFYHVGTLTSADYYVQGATAFGDLYFQAAYQMRYVVIYDLKNEVEVQRIDLEVGEVEHANNLSFGAEYYADDDPFPLLYVSSTENKKLYAYRVTGTRGNYSMSIVQTITLDTDFYYPDAVIDIYAGRGVLFGYKENSWQSDANGNAFLISTFKLPKLAEGDVTITEYSDTVTLPFIYADQGAMARSGILYLASGVEVPIIYVINYRNGEFLSTIYTSMAEDTEPEGLGIWENKLVVSYISKKIQVISFD